MPAPSERVEIELVHFKTIFASSNIDRTKSAVPTMTQMQLFKDPWEKELEESESAEKVDGRYTKADLSVLSLLAEK
jgi:hypothetical protein